MRGEFMQLGRSLGDEVCGSKDKIISDIMTLRCL